MFILSLTENAVDTEDVTEVVSQFTETPSDGRQLDMNPSSLQNHPVGKLCFSSVIQHLRCVHQDISEGHSVFLAPRCWARF